jgi:hypothetical protein
MANTGCIFVDCLQLFIVVTLPVKLACYHITDMFNGSLQVAHKYTDKTKRHELSQIRHGNDE